MKSIEGLSDSQRDYYFRYLDQLRNSGRTNMFAAGAYLKAECGLDRELASTVLGAWMANYEEWCKYRDTELQPKQANGYITRDAAEEQVFVHMSGYAVEEMFESNNLVARDRRGKIIPNPSRTTMEGVLIEFLCGGEYEYRISKGKIRKHEAVA